MARKGRKHRKLTKRLTHKSKSKKYHTLNSKFKIMDELHKISKHALESKFDITTKQIRVWQKREASWRIRASTQQKPTKFVQNSKHCNAELFKIVNDQVKDMI